MKKICLLLLALMLLVSSSVAETVVTTQAFTDAAVKQEDLEAIVQAGFSTASAINQQPWFFAVVTNKDVMAEINKGGMMPPSGMTPPSGKDAPGGAGAPAGMPPAGASGAKASVGDSPVAIVIYMANDSKSPDPHFDCGLACQNMVVAANALGYGTKIVSAPTMTLNDERHDEICGILNVDTSMSAVAVLLIGYRDVDVETSPTTRDTTKASYIN